MEKVILNADKREETGKQAVKKLRKDGMIPVVCYKGGKESINLKVRVRDMHDVLHTKAGENVLITLIPSGLKSAKEKTVIIKELQTDPLKGEVIHVDFNEISLTDKIKIKVPVVTRGEAKEVAKEEGTVEHILWEIEIECLPTEIPENIQVEISGMKIGDAVLVRDLNVPSGIKVLTDSEGVVITAKPPVKLEVKEEVPGEEGADEPEVIAKGKKPVEGEEEEEAGAPQKQEKAEKKE